MGGVVRKDLLGARPAVDTARGEARRHLRRLVDISEELAVLRRRDADLVARRDERIIACLAAGVSAAQIARATEMTSGRVRQIKGAAIASGELPGEVMGRGEYR